MHKIYDSEGVGEVQVSEEVIAIIAGLAATEVEGVFSMAGNITGEIVAKLGRKKLSSGVTLFSEDGLITVILALVVEYGYNIPQISAAVQERVKTAIETMTGLQVKEVDIRIANVNTK